MLEKNYFNDIKDIILWNWWKVQTGDLKYSRKNVNMGTEKQDIIAYERINDSYIAEFGIDKTQLEIIDIQKRIAILQCDFVIEENRFLINEIERLKKEIFELLNNGNKGDRDGLVIHLEKWLGFRIDEKKITANKFYKIVREFERENEAVRKANK
tara:strand:- start:463 stop:927 length:465 start_codon:yes stop_codon:yes gene_type:complete